MFNLDSKGSLLSNLVEQASVKPSELEAHPVRNQTQLLLKTLDQHILTMPGSSRQIDFVQRCFHYMNTLAAIVLRSLNTELGIDSLLHGSTLEGNWKNGWLQNIPGALAHSDLFIFTGYFAIFFKPINPVQLLL